MSADDDWLAIEDAPLDDAINGDAEPTDDAASEFQAKMRQEFPRYRIPAKLRDQLNATR